MRLFWRKISRGYLALPQPLVFCSHSFQLRLSVRNTFPQLVHQFAELFGVYTDNVGHKGDLQGFSKQKRKKQESWRLEKTVHVRTNKYLETL